MEKFTDNREVTTEILPSQRNLEKEFSSARTQLDQKQLRTQIEANELSPEKVAVLQTFQDYVTTVTRHIKAGNYEFRTATARKLLSGMVNARVRRVENYVLPKFERFMRTTDFDAKSLPASFSEFFSLFIADLLDRGDEQAVQDLKDLFSFSTFRVVPIIRQHNRNVETLLEDAQKKLKQEKIILAQAKNKSLAQIQYRSQLFDVFEKYSEKVIDRLDPDAEKEAKNALKKLEQQYQIWRKK